MKRLYLLAAGLIASLPAWAARGQAADLFGATPCRQISRFAQAQGAPRVLFFQRREFVREVTRKFVRADFSVARHVEHMRRITALLVVTHHVISRLLRRARGLARIERRRRHQAETELVTEGQETCGHRHLAPNLSQRHIAAVGQHQVGVAAAPRELLELAEQLGRAGVTRICALGQMTSPEAGWHHDGRFSLLDLVTMVDIDSSAEAAAELLAPYVD